MPCEHKLWKNFIGKKKFLDKSPDKTPWTNKSCLVNLEHLMKLPSLPTASLTLFFHPLQHEPKVSVLTLKKKPKKYVYCNTYFSYVWVFNSVFMTLRLSQQLKTIKKFLKYFKKTTSVYVFFSIIQKYEITF